MDSLKFETIKLLEPDTKKGKNFMEILSKRHTEREYSGKNLTLKQISELLWVCYGQSHNENKNKTVPSGLAVYPLELYIVFKDSIFKYNPEANELIPLKQGNYYDKVSMGIQNYVNNSALNILIYTNLNKNSGNEKYDEFVKKNPNLKIKSACIEAGCISENAYLYCENEGLKIVCRALCDGKFFADLLGLQHHEFITSVCVGV